MEGKQYKEGPQGLSKFTDEEDEPPGPSKVQNDGVQSKAPLDEGEGGPPCSSKFTDEGDEPPGPFQDDGGQFKAPLEGLSRPSEVHNEREEPLEPIKFQDEGGQSQAPYVGDDGPPGPSEIQSEGDGPLHIDHITHNSGPYWKCNFP